MVGIDSYANAGLSRRFRRHLNRVCRHQDPLPLKERVYWHVPYVAEKGVICFGRLVKRQAPILEEQCARLLLAWFVQGVVCLWRLVKRQAPILE